LRARRQGAAPRRNSSASRSSVSIIPPQNSLLNMVVPWQAPLDLLQDPVYRERLAAVRALVLLELLHRIPVEAQILDYVLEGRFAAAPAHEEREPLRVERIVREEVDLLLLHLAAALAGYTTNLEPEVDPGVATGQVADHDVAGGEIRVVVVRGVVRAQPLIEGRCERGGFTGRRAWW